MGCPPGDRCTIAVELVKCGVSQVEAARMLEIAPSAVSQYLSGKRGYRIEFENDIKQSIEQLARDLKEGRDVNLVQRTCDICHQLPGGRGVPVRKQQHRQPAVRQLIFILF